MGAANKLVASQPRFGLAFAIAVIADMLDYLVIGAIPIYGDILDLIVMGILFKLIGPLSLAGIIELVPVVGDLVPTYTVAVIGAYVFNKRR